ncbi:MAG: hypothetical protein IAG10_27650 [Planctomycetaceae bacterium]|nr:hypothetical protein [Planctomycetaceae bacterium]
MDAIECDRRDLAGNLHTVLDTEAKDRQNYQPVRFEAVPIRMRQPAAGYHGPTKGTYILFVEEYPSAQAAKIRADEYTSAGWTKRIPRGDSLEVEGKSSVRCWGISSGTSAYLLTTHAYMYDALETLNHDIKNKLTKHLLNNP